MIIDNLSKTISDFVNDLNIEHNEVYVSYMNNEDFFVFIKNKTIYVNISFDKISEYHKKYNKYSESKILFFMIAKQLFHIVLNHINENKYLGNRQDIKNDIFNTNIEKIAKEIETNQVIPIGIHAKDYNFEDGHNWTYYYEKLYDLSKNKKNNENENNDESEQNNNQNTEDKKVDYDYSNDVNTNTDGSVEANSYENQTEESNDVSSEIINNKEVLKNNENINNSIDNQDIDNADDDNLENYNYNQSMIEKIINNYDEKYVNNSDEYNINVVTGSDENIEDENKTPIYRGGGKGISDYNIELLNTKISNCNEYYFNLDYKKIFEFFIKNLVDGLEDQNFKYGNIKKSSYFKLNNRTTLDSQFIIPGKTKAYDENFDITNYTGIAVLVDFSGSTYNHNDLLNKLCCDLLEYTEDVYTYDYYLRHKYDKNFIEASAGGTNLKRVLKDLGKKLGRKRYYILTDGLDDSINYCIDNYDMNIFYYGENQLELSIYRKGKIIQNIKK